MKIINTVKQFPDEVYEYVVRNVQFEKAMDCGLPNPQIRKNFLVLEKDDASEAAIAHEIAHAYLKHPARTNISVEQATKFEEEAKALSSKWLKKPNFHRNKFPIQIAHDVQESNFGLRFIGGAAILMFIWY